MDSIAGQARAGQGTVLVGTSSIPRKSNTKGSGVWMAVWIPISTFTERGISPYVELRFALSYLPTYVCHARDLQK